jgi:predicted dehydrogenase
MNQSAPPSTLDRRAFLKCSLTLATAFGSGIAVAAESKQSGRGKISAAILGHTGRGDYGHSLDLIFNNRTNIQVSALADPVASGRAAAALRSKALRQYEDYRVMLEKEKPRLVCVAPRWTDQHHAMASAALGIGAHVFMEKPITQTLAQADDLLAKADAAGLKIAIAHQMRLAPGILHLKSKIDEGLLGELLQIRAFGKQDARAGGEDMLVLGSHLFDLIRFFAGDAQWCTAQVRQGGHDISRRDAHEAKESIGLIAGDEIEAQFGFGNGVTATFTSRAKLRQNVSHWGLELIGSKTNARIFADIFPQVFLLHAGTWEETGRNDRWQRLEGDPTIGADDRERGTELANKRVVDDWLEAIEKKRQPVCSGFAGMKALEMIMAVYHAALSARRVPLPLADRAHPLSER